MSTSPRPRFAVFQPAPPVLVTLVEPAVTTMPSPARPPRFAATPIERKLTGAISGPKLTKALSRIDLFWALIQLSVRKTLATRTSSMRPSKSNPRLASPSWPITSGVPVVAIAPRPLLAEATLTPSTKTSAVFAPSFQRPTR